MLLPVHLWLSAVAAFNNCQLPGQFTSSEQLKQAAAQWFCLFQEALLIPISLAAFAWGGSSSKFTTH
jgi:hypothetical protein